MLERGGALVERCRNDHVATSSTTHKGRTPAPCKRGTFFQQSELRATSLLPERSPPWLMLTCSHSLASSSSFLTASTTCRGLRGGEALVRMWKHITDIYMDTVSRTAYVILVFLLSRAALPASSRTSATRSVRSPIPQHSPFDSCRWRGRGQASLFGLTLENGSHVDCVPLTLLQQASVWMEKRLLTWSTCTDSRSPLALSVPKSQVR